MNRSSSGRNASTSLPIDPWSLLNDTLPPAASDTSLGGLMLAPSSSSAWLTVNSTDFVNDKINMRVKQPELNLPPSMTAVAPTQLAVL